MVTIKRREKIFYGDASRLDFRGHLPVRPDYFSTTRTVAVHTCLFHLRADGTALETMACGHRRIFRAADGTCDECRKTRERLRRIRSSTRDRPPVAAPTI